MYLKSLEKERSTDDSARFRFCLRRQRSWQMMTAWSLQCSAWQLANGALIELIRLADTSLTFMIVGGRGRLINWSSNIEHSLNLNVLRMAYFRPVYLVYIWKYFHDHLAKWVFSFEDPQVFLLTSEKKPPFEITKVFSEITPSRQGTILLAPRISMLKPMRWSSLDCFSEWPQ